MIKPLEATEEMKRGESGSSKWLLQFIITAAAHTQICRNLLTQTETVEPTWLSAELNTAFRGRTACVPNHFLFTMSHYI